MCLYPIEMQKAIDKSTGEIFVCPSTWNVPNVVDTFCVPCGKCLECLKAQSTEWSFRIMQELQAYNGVGCMITLTYSDTDGNLHKDDLQKFLKRLRKHYSDISIRYFACGEYGSKHSRPHYHVILFGVDFSEDLYFWNSSERGYKISRSPTLEKLWSLGFSCISEINLYTAKYSAKYLQKLQSVPLGLVKPFVCMSTHPGIGYNSISPTMLETDKIYVHGSYIKTPRYYLKVLDRQGYDLTTLKANRLEKAKIFEKSFDELSRARKKQKLFCKK